MGKVQEIFENGISIIRIDLSGMGTGTREAYLEIMAEAKRLIASKAAKTALTLTLVNRIKLDETAIADLKAYMEHNKPYVGKGAVLGIEGLTKVAFNTFNQVLGRNLRVFATEKDAIAWLVYTGK